MFQRLEEFASAKEQLESDLYEKVCKDTCTQVNEWLLWPNNMKANYKPEYDSHTEQHFIELRGIVLFKSMDWLM